jgi:nitrogen fixation protein FixH
MKFNWGTGIALVYGAFALIMVGVVVLSQQHDPGLISKDYYNLDLNYQEHFDKKQNTVNLPDVLEVRYDAVRKVIRLQFPAKVGTPAGAVKCYRSATAQDDFNLDVQTNPEGVMEIPADQLTKGLWHLEIDWQANGTKYFNEALVTITHA